MILDKGNLVSSAQAVTSSAGSTDVIDLSQARAIGDGEELEFFVNVDTAATAAGAATVTFQVQTDDNSAFSSPTTLIQTDAIPKATLVAGYQIKIPLPDGATPERYLRLYYSVATGPLTAGAFTAGLVLDAQNSRAYPSGYTIA